MVTLNDVKKYGITKEEFDKKTKEWNKMVPKEKIRWNGFFGFLIGERKSKLFQESA